MALASSCSSVDSFAAPFLLDDLKSKFSGKEKRTYFGNGKQLFQKLIIQKSRIYLKRELKFCAIN